MLLVWKQTVESADLNQILLTNGSYVELGSVSDLLFRHQAKELIFSFEWASDFIKLQLPNRHILSERAIFVSPKVESLEFNISIQVTDDDVVQVDSFEYKFVAHQTNNFHVQNGSFGMQLVETEDTEENYKPIIKGYTLKEREAYEVRLTRPVKSYRFPVEFYQKLHEVQRLWHQFPAAIEEQFQHVYYLGAFREYFRRIYTWSGDVPKDVGNRGGSAIEALIASINRRGNTNGDRDDPLNIIVAKWLKTLGLIDDFIVRPIAKRRREYEVFVRVQPESPEVLITDVGFGISQVLPVLILCYYAPRGSTIILEQPEIHLHPAVQSGLADVFIDAIKTRNIQIILESHSEHLLRRLQRRIAEEQLDPTDAALYFVNMKKGISKLEKLKLDSYGNIHNWPENFFGNELEDMGAMLEAEMKRKLEQNGQ